MVVVLFADGRRQRGIHGGVPHNWIGVIADECSLVTSGMCAIGDGGSHRWPGVIVTGRQAEDAAARAEAELPGLLQASSP